jgi:hypothetical protein
MTADSTDVTRNDVSIRSPERADYRLLIEREWADLHHSRIQEWTALGVVLAAHVAVLQLLSLTQAASVAVPLATRAIIGCILGVMFAVLGALVTCRHRRLMEVKLTWIFRAEDKLGLIRNPDRPGGILPTSAKMVEEEPEWNGITIPPRFLSTSGLIFYLYVCLVILDLAAVVVFAAS